MLLRVIDFETANSGDEGENGIIEVGCSDLRVDQSNGQYAIEHSWSELCDPGIEIDPAASAVHHLTKTHIKGSPHFSAIEPNLLDGPPNYFVAHNAKFEQALFAGGNIPWICTYKIALRIWPEQRSHALQFLRYSLPLNTQGYDLGLPHRAGPDTIVCALLMARIVEEGKFSFEDMARLSNGPPLLPRMTFGKHKGEPWSEVPDSYLQWMLEQPDMDRDQIANAKYHLKLRSQG